MPENLLKRIVEAGESRCMKCLKEEETNDGAIKMYAFVRDNLSSVRDVTGY